jgi:L-threonylcarbamoyladenylate synthase
LTLVLPRSRVVPDEITAGLDTVALRVPAHPVARALLVAAGVPVAAPSANLFSRPSPTQAAHVLEDLDGRIDVVVDGGSTTIGVESTVLDLTGATPIVLRPGRVSLDELREVLPDVRTASATGGSAPMRSPGLLEKHYSPRAPLTLYTGDVARALARLLADAEQLVRVEGARVGLVVWAGDSTLVRASAGRIVADLGARDRLEEAAARLYAALREIDRADVDRILALDVVGTRGLAAAIRDRLTRAAAGRVIRVD